MFTRKKSYMRVLSRSEEVDDKIMMVQFSHFSRKYNVFGIGQ